MVKHLSSSSAFFLAAVHVVGCNGSTASPGDVPPPVSTSATAPRIVKPAVAWPARTRVDERARGRLGDGSDRIDRASVPVLAPASDLAIERPTLIVEPEFYAITVRARGATINIQGTRPAHVVEDVPPHPGNRSMRGAKGFVTMNEGIRSAAFVENGVAYTVDVECATADDDRCVREDFIVDLVERLAFVGGRGR